MHEHAGARAAAVCYTRRRLRGCQTVAATAAATVVLQLLRLRLLHDVALAVQQQLRRALLLLLR
jgi:hypothetical protein